MSQIQVKKCSEILCEKEGVREYFLNGKTYFFCENHYNSYVADRFGRRMRK